MFTLILTTCVTIATTTHCQEYPRAPVYPSTVSCEMAGAIEQGRYHRKIVQRREWLSYSWQCRPVPGKRNTTARVSDTK